MAEQSFPPCTKLLGQVACCSIYLNGADGLFLTKTKDQCLPIDPESISSASDQLQENRSKPTNLGQVRTRLLKF